MIINLMGEIENRIYPTDSALPRSYEVMVDYFRRSMEDARAGKVEVSLSPEPETYQLPEPQAVYVQALYEHRSAMCAAFGDPDIDLMLAHQRLASAFGHYEDVLPYDDKRTSDVFDVSLDLVHLSCRIWVRNEDDKFFTTAKYCLDRAEQLRDDALTDARRQRYRTRQLLAARSNVKLMQYLKDPSPEARIALKEALRELEPSSQEVKVPTLEYGDRALPLVMQPIIDRVSAKRRAQVKQLRAKNTVPFMHS